MSENESVVEITWLLEGTAEIYLTQIDENECSSTESVELNIFLNIKCLLRRSLLKK